jgi:twitching motility protein PilT
VNRINSFLELAIQQRGSDLHLISGEPPRIRIHGALHAIRFRTLSIEDMHNILVEIMTEDQMQRFADQLAVDFAYEAPGLGRFRTHVYRHHRGIGAALRAIPSRIPELEELGLPSSVKSMIGHRKGLTLVTGPTGSGKSTTLASMIDMINANNRGHIITIEDPIEFMHSFKQCVVSQREIGFHAPTFAEALRSGVREDPDVIMVGELRDLETISLALTAAETGVQVLATLHTKGSVGTVTRIVNVFPERRQEMVRNMLSDGLRMIVSQQLVRTADGAGRVAAAEVLINTAAVASIIRSGQTHKLATVMQSGRKAGMQTLDAQLKDLLLKKIITAEEAHEHANDRTQFERHILREEAA